MLLRLWLHLHKQKRPLQITAVLLAIALMTSGCVFTFTFSSGGHQLVGTVVLGDRYLLMDEARVTLSGPVWRQSSTNSYGCFSFYNLPDGVYTLTAETLAGVSEQRVKMISDRRITVVVPYRQGLDERRFFDISGLWDVYVDRNGNIVRAPGRNLRWRPRKQVAVFVDAAFDLDWREAIWAYMTAEWQDLPVAWSYATTPGESDLEIERCPANTLDGNAAGITKFKDYEGYVYKVYIAIDEQYGDLRESPVVAHEIWHGIGAGHVDWPPSSILYPYAGAQQPPYELAEDEREYLWYAYAIAPNQSVSLPRAMAVEGEQVRAMRVPAAPGVVTVLRRADGSSEVVEGVPDFMRKSKRLQQILQETKGQDGFLWDQISE